MAAGVLRWWAEGAADFWPEACFEASTVSDGLLTDNNLSANAVAQARATLVPESLWTLRESCANMLKFALLRAGDEVGADLQLGIAAVVNSLAARNAGPSSEIN